MSQWKIIKNHSVIKKYWFGEFIFLIVPECTNFPQIFSPECNPHDPFLHIADPLQKGGLRSKQQSRKSQYVIKNSLKVIEFYCWISVWTIGSIL